MFGDSFAKMPRGPSLFLREFLWLAMTIILVTWVGLPLFFDPPKEPVRFVVLARSPLSCEGWEPIVGGRDRLSDFWGSVFKDPGTIVEPCKQLEPSDPDPIANPRFYIKTGQGLAVLSSVRSNCGSDEARSEEERYYLIVCSPSPSTYDALSWSHEGFHIALGHTALRHTLLHLVPSLPDPLDQIWKTALNTFLDVGYVDQALILGRRGALWLRSAALAVWLAWFLFLRRIRSSALQNLGTDRQLFPET
jgi:hypothetical protein